MKLSTTAMRRTYPCSNCSQVESKAVRINADRARPPKDGTTNRLRSGFVLWASMLLIFSAATHELTADELPKGVTNTQNPSDVSLSPQESLAKITVPEGFRVTLFAGEPDIRRPIAFDFDDRGRLWVVENYSHPNFKESTNSDRIVILEDTDWDGKFDKRKVFFEGGRYFSAIAYGHGGVWVGNSPELIFIPDADGDDVPDGKPIVKLDGFKETSTNMLNNFHWGPDGWLYGAVGYAGKSSIGPPGTLAAKRKTMTRGIWRYHPVHKSFDVVARGMVNPWGADFNEFGDLFTANTVNAHLWHIVPGMLCQRRAREQENRYAYARIKSIADHLHWGGGTWQSSRANTDVHSVAGGGHAHCGGMIYLGDNWPKKYRGTFFTINLHGNRINNDRLVPNRSTYVGTHEDDFLFANDAWFRGLTIKYGPSGCVFVSDWHDFGECHDKDGSHRSSGRIYRIEYLKNGKPTPPPVFFTGIPDIANEFMPAFHSNQNEWGVRRARRILHERKLAGRNISDTVPGLNDILKESKSTRDRLRSLWTLWLLGEIDDQRLSAMTNEGDEHLRRWIVRLLAEPLSHGNSLLAPVLRSFRRMASEDASPKVRLELASALQKLEHKDRWPIAEQLLSHSEDVTDPYIPLMIWYGVEPLVVENLDRALELAAESKIPIVRQYIVRRALDQKNPPLDQIFQFVAAIDNDRIQADCLRGMIEAIETRSIESPPKNWPAFSQEMARSEDESIRWMTERLAILFGDEQAIAKLRATVASNKEALKERQAALRSLLRLENGVTANLLHGLVERDDELRIEAIRGLTLNGDERTADVLLKKMDQFDDGEKKQAVSVLVSRLDSSKKLLAAIGGDRSLKESVSAYDLQQLRSYRDESLQKQVTATWNESEIMAKSNQIARFKEIMNSEFRLSGSAAHGRVVFEQNCAKCHTLFDEGGSLGPNLTGSGRKDIDYVLRNLVDPSAEIDPAYRQSIIETEDGRMLSGIVIEHTDNTIAMNTRDGQVQLPMSKVDSIETSKLSMMPEGLLQHFTDEEVRDLILYLASPDQVELP